MILASFCTKITNMSKMTRKIAFSHSKLVISKNEIQTLKETKLSSCLWTRFEIDPTQIEGQTTNREKKERKFHENFFDKKFRSKNDEKKTGFFVARTSKNPPLTFGRAFGSRITRNAAGGRKKIPYPKTTNEWERFVPEFFAKKGRRDVFERNRPFFSTSLEFPKLNSHRRGIAFTKMPEWVVCGKFCGRFFLRVSSFFPFFVCFLFYFF